MTRSGFLIAFTASTTGVHGKRGGTGLGLSIVKAAVEAHGGTVSLADDPSGGSIFRAVFSFSDLPNIHS